MSFGSVGGKSLVRGAAGVGALSILNPGAFRVFLAALVVLSHFSAIQVGRLGVALFFMLSGFWITSLWTRMGGFPHTGKFLLNRFFRIFPLYLFVTLLCLALFEVRLTPSTFVLLGVASTEGPRAIGVEWSLDVELQFYLAFPLLYAAWTLWGRWSAVLFAALLGVGWWIYRSTDVITVFQYLPMFLFGMWIFFNKTRFSAGLAHGSLAVFVLFFVICYLVPITHSQAVADGSPQLLDVDIFAMIWSTLLVPYVGFSLTKRSDHVDRVLGDFSFPLYLIHEPVIRLAKNHVQIASLSSKVLLLVAILVCAGLLYAVVDRPIERLRRRVLG